MRTEQAVSETSGHGLLLPFDCDDPEFVRGFECGHVWTEVRNCEDVAVGPYTMHAANAEMAIRIAEATGRLATSEEVGNEWIQVVFVMNPEVWVGLS